MKTPKTAISELIASRSSYLLVTHVDPDGDGIGSCLALQHVLQGLGKSARVWLPKGVPDKYGFLPGAETVVTESGPEPVTMALDCDGERRLGATKDVALQAEVVVDIDHHADSAVFGDIAWADPAAPASGYQVYELVKALGAPFTPEVATCLYCAVGTDSGFFRYKNTSPRLLRMAAEMIEHGADPKAIAEATLDRYDPAVVMLGGRALSSLEIRLDGRAAVAVLRTADLEAAGTEQTEGVIDYLRTVRGVDLLVLLREAEDGWRVSMRSLAEVDVSIAAKALGGGGHAPAAGCTLDGDLETARAQLEGELRKAIDRHAGGRA